MSRKRSLECDQADSQTFHCRVKSEPTDFKIQRLVGLPDEPHTKQPSRCHSAQSDFSAYNERLSDRACVSPPPDVSSPVRFPVARERNEPHATRNEFRDLAGLCLRSPYGDSACAERLRQGCHSTSGIQDDDVDSMTSSIEVDGIRVSLEDVDLWQTFYRCGTEMIVNRPGRRMFPSVTVTVTGLDPSATYTMLMEVVPADDKRYKYVNNRWTVVGKSDPAINNKPFVHPDSPSRGSFWMQTKISFAKVKITNNRDSDEGNILIHSMHKYMAKVTIIRQKRSESETERDYVFSIPLTSFIAVTAYQSENITQMKIRNNPFAKAFRDGDLSGLLHSGSSNWHRSRVISGAESLYEAPHTSSRSRPLLPDSLRPCVLPPTGAYPNYTLPQMPFPFPPSLYGLPPSASPTQAENRIMGSQSTPGFVFLPPMWPGLSHADMSMTSSSRNDAMCKWINACAAMHAAHAQSAGMMSHLSRGFNVTEPVLPSREWNKEDSVVSSSASVSRS